MRRTEERRARLPHLLEVNKITKQARSRERAARLHQEALNCLTIAVKEDETHHSADLIDEALKLAKRARELNEVE